MAIFPTNDSKKDDSRERSDADMTPTDAATAGISADSRDPNSDARPQRIPLGQGLNLDISNSTLDKKNYYYHWFVEMPDKPGRIDGAKAAYYEHVTDGSGKNITRPAGGGVFYLMRIPVKFRNEDLALKKKKVDATMDQQTRLAPNEYAPDRNTLKDEGGTSAVHRDTSENPFS